MAESTPCDVLVTFQWQCISCTMPHISSIIIYAATTTTLQNSMLQFCWRSSRNQWSHVFSVLPLDVRGSRFFRNPKRTQPDQTFKKNRTPWKMIPESTRILYKKWIQTRLAQITEYCYQQQRSLHDSTRDMCVFGLDHTFSQGSFTYYDTLFQWFQQIENTNNSKIRVIRVRVGFGVFFWRFRVTSTSLVVIFRTQVKSQTKSIKRKVWTFGMSNVWPIPSF